MQIDKYAFLLSLLFSLLFISEIVFPQTSSVTGRVIDYKGVPVKNADVFCEQGLFRPLSRVVTNENGEFNFVNLLSEPTGIFATSEGFSWNGIHINIPPDEHIENLEILLGPSSNITGKVLFRDNKNREIPIKGVEITRFAILGDEKVSIPLNKLGDFGYKRVFTDVHGNYVVDKIPRNTLISLKLEHPDFAVTSTEETEAGRHMVTYLEKGCLILGSVYLGESDVKKKVPGAQVLIKNTKPPFETTSVTTNTQGEFTVRVKQGNYLCFAQTDKYLTPGWILKLVGNPDGEYINLPVFPSVNIYGVVRDAVTTEPVKGVRIYAEQGGQRVGIVSTGGSGKFKFRVAKGHLTLRFDSIPGYTLPTPSVMKIAIPGTGDIELPGIWVRKLDTIKIALKGVERIGRGFVSMLNPYQFGWVNFNSSYVEIPIGSLPAQGKLVGWLLIPEDDLGHVFNLDTSSLGRVCEVELSKNSSLIIDCVDSATNKLSGIALDCFVVDGVMEYRLFRAFIVNRGENKFRLEGIPSNVPLKFRILDFDGKTVWSSELLNLSPKEVKDLGTVKLDILSPANTTNPIDFWDYDKMDIRCGNSSNFKYKQTLLMNLKKEDVPFVLEPLKKIGEYFGGRITIGIILEDNLECDELGVPIIRSRVPIRGSTVLIDESGKMKFETDGLPLILSVFIKS